MPRARDPNRDKAYEIWKQHKGKIKLKDIAAELGVSDSQIRKWKSQDKWEQSKGNVTNSKRSVTKQKSTPEPVIESDDLNDKQKLFCLYYIKSFNATQSAIKAGYSPDRAHVTGSELVRNRKVSEEIRRLKGNMAQELYVDATDVLQKWVKIAFADITDFVEFGIKTEMAKEMVGMGDNGPIFEEKEYQFNYVDFKNFDQVDGTLITEVKKGKDGVSIKLADKMKALEKLSLYFDLFPDQFKRKIEDEKLKIAQFKIQNNDDEELEDDGFLEALDGKEVNWNEEA